MPELPEVETTRRGIAPHLIGQQITGLTIRDHRLRWPVRRDLGREMLGNTIHAVDRRAKYLLLRMDNGTLILHLGMSGSLRIVPAGSAPRKHDHFDLTLANNQVLRFHDPRRFGAILWTRRDPYRHPCLADLGPEPLGPEFTGEYLYQRSRGRKQAIKSLIMDGRVVVGVGNIYACEALFKAGIHPRIAAGRISRSRYVRLVTAIQTVLQEAIQQGGTTLRDFTQSNGEPGYFALSLNVYGREGKPCTSCGRPIRQITIGQRSSFYCAHCQH